MSKIDKVTPLLCFSTLSLSLSTFLLLFCRSAVQWVIEVERVEILDGVLVVVRFIWWGVCVCVCVVAERLKKRERSKKNKGESIYADQHFLSFTMFRSWILLQAFSIVFQRFPNPEKLKQPQPPSHSDASALTPLTLFFLCLFLLLYIVFVLYEKLGARLFLKF